MGLTCSQSAAGTRPHLPFGETRPPSVPSRPLPALLQSPAFQLPSSTCKPKHTTTITAVGQQYPGAISLHHPPSTILKVQECASTKPLAAGHRLPSSPLICRGAAGQPPCPASQPSPPVCRSVLLGAGASKRRSFLHDLQCWSRVEYLSLDALCLCLCLTALAALPAQKRQSVSRVAYAW